MRNAPVKTGVEQCVHALEGRLPNVKAVIDRVLEGAHLHLTNKLFLQTTRKHVIMQSAKHISTQKFISKQTTIIVSYKV